MGCCCFFFFLRLNWKIGKGKHVVDLESPQVISPLLCSFVAYGDPRAGEEGVPVRDPPAWWPLMMLFAH